MLQNEFLIVVAAFVVGIIASRFYTKLRGPLLKKRRKDAPAEETGKGGKFKDLNGRTPPFGQDIMFMPPLYSVMRDAEDNFGKPLNQNEFNRARNNAGAIFADVEDICAAEDETGRPNDFSLDAWQRWQKEDSEG